MKKKSPYLKHKSFGIAYLYFKVNDVSSLISLQPMMALIWLYCYGLTTIGRYLSKLSAKI